MIGQITLIAALAMLGASQANAAATLTIDTFGGSTNISVPGTLSFLGNVTAADARCRNTGDIQWRSDVDCSDCWQWLWGCGSGDHHRPRGLLNRFHPSLHYSRIAWR